jgi:hypothetical protein
LINQLKIPEARVRSKTDHAAALRPKADASKKQ